MVDKKTEDKPEDQTEDKSTAKAEEVSGGPKAPNEDKSLPQGIYGGPATINNPVKQSVVSKEK